LRRKITEMVSKNLSKRKNENSCPKTKALARRFVADFSALTKTELVLTKTVNFK